MTDLQPWFIDRFEDIARRGDERWRARCPICGSRRALGINAGEDRWRVNCFGASGNKRHVREALAVVGLTFEDMLYESERRNVREPARSTRWLLKQQTQGGVGRPARNTVLPREPLIAHEKEAESPEVDELLDRYEQGGIPSSELPVGVRPRIPSATAPMNRVADFYWLMLGLRRWADMRDADEVAFGRSWVAAHVGLPSATVQRAMKRLEDAGFIRRAGQLAARPGKRGLLLWAPGALVDDDQLDDLVVREAELDAEPPALEDAVVGEEQLGEAADLVPVLEAPAVVSSGLGASLRGAGDHLGLLGHKAPPATGTRSTIPSLAVGSGLGQ